MGRGGAVLKAAVSISAFADALRQARLRQGRLVADVAQACLLSENQINGIEADNYQAFYSGFFAKQAVRRYAEYLGVAIDLEGSPFYTAAAPPAVIESTPPRGREAPSGINSGMHRDTHRDDARHSVSDTATDTRVIVPLVTPAKTEPEVYSQPVASVASVTGVPAESSKRQQRHHRVAIALGVLAAVVVIWQVVRSHEMTQSAQPPAVAMSDTAAGVTAQSGESVTPTEPVSVAGTGAAGTADTNSAVLALKTGVLAPAPTLLVGPELLLVATHVSALSALTHSPSTSAVSQLAPPQVTGVGMASASVLAPNSTAPLLRNVPPAVREGSAASAQIMTTGIPQYSIITLSQNMPDEPRYRFFIKVNAQVELRVTDAAGQTLLNHTALKTGDSARVIGKPPFHVHVNDPDAVEIYYLYRRYRAYTAATGQPELWLVDTTVTSNTP